MEKKTEPKTTIQILNELGVDIYTPDFTLMQTAMINYNEQQSIPLWDKIRELEADNQRLFNEKQDQARTIEEYHKSGNKQSYPVLCKQIESLQKELEDKQYEIVEKDREIGKMKSTLNQNLTELLKQDKEIESLQSDLNRMREGITKIAVDKYSCLNSRTIAESLLSNSSKEETNQDPKSERMTGVDKIYSCLSDIQRATPMPYNDSNEIIAELLKIKDSLIKIKSL